MLVLTKKLCLFMKSKLFMFLLCVATLFSCEREDESVLNTLQKNYTVESTGGRVEVYLQTDDVLDVRFEPAVDWFYSLKTETINMGRFTFECQANKTSEERKVKVFFTTPGSNTSEIIEVTQKANSEYEPLIKSFAFLVKDNQELLTRDIYGTIDDDGTIDVRIPYIVRNKKLTPSIEFQGKSIRLKTQDEETSTETMIDFTETVSYIVEGITGKQKEYFVSVYSNNGIPVIYIKTENNTPIVSKDDYVNGNIILDGNNSVPSMSGAMRIKGRGNSTWTLPKKPYKIKFDKKQSLAGFPADKEWVLLANYADKTSLRNEFAFSISRMTALEYTPRTQFCDLYVNREYMGLYQLTEQLKIADERVNVTNNGFLLEVDQPDRLDPDDISFKTDRILLCIKDPDIECDSEQYNWIKNYVTNVENVLYGEKFTDPTEGYAKYLDLESFADWYLVNEINRNNDAAFFSSCYMNITPGGKLKMGPVWDFDIASGNCNYNGVYSPEGFTVKNSVWISRLFEDPEFVKVVKQRFLILRSRQSEFIKNLNSTGNLIQSAKIQDEGKWMTAFSLTWPNYVALGSWESEVSYLKSWIITRMDWLENEFMKM